MSIQTSLSSLESLLEGFDTLDSSISEDLFGSNDVDLTEVQIASIQHSIMATESGNATAGALLTGLEALVARAREICERRNRYVKNQRRLLSTIRRIPAEIWAEVFLIAVHVNKRTCVDNFFRPQQPSISFSWVCRSWRETALNTPGLWSHITVFLTYTPSPPPTEWLKAFLERSRTKKLSIELLFNRNVEITGGMKHFYSVLLHSRDRWKEIRFSVSRSHLLSALFLSPLRCKALVKVEIVVPFEAGYQASIFFVDSPLKQISLEGCSMHIVDSRQSIWSELSSLRLELIKVSSLLDVLRLAPRLSDLNVMLYHPTDIHPANPKVTHKGLQSVEISGDCDVFLESLSAPDLKSLIIKYHSGSSGKEHFARFLERSRNLTKLKVFADWFHLVTDYNLLQELGYLSLKMDPFDSEDSLLSVIHNFGTNAASGTLQDPLPLLDHLDINVRHVFHNLSLFKQLIKSLSALYEQITSDSRPHMVPNLNTITLSVQVPEGSDELKWFRELQSSRYPCLRVFIDTFEESEDSRRSDSDE